MRSLTTALFATAATARLMDSLPSIPQGWTQVREAALNEPITLRLALPQQYADALEQKVIEISTPGHSNYGKHLSRLELRSYTAPTAEAVSSVADWLSRSNIKSSVNNDWMTFSTTVEKANELLNTTFAWYQYKEGGGPKLRTLEYSVPDDLAQYVDLIQPTTRFGQLGAKKSTIFDMHILDPVDEKAKIAKIEATGDVAADCNVNQITPTCLKSLYNIKYTPEADGNLVAFASYLEEYARYSDLASFERQWLPSATGQNFTVELVNGGLNNQNSNDDSGVFSILCPSRDLILT